MGTYKNPLSSNKRTYLDPLNPDAKPIEKKPIVVEPVQQIATAPKKGGFSFDNLLPKAQNGLNTVKNKIDDFNDFVNPIVKKAALTPMKTIGKSLLNNSPLGMVNNIAKLGGTDLKGMYGLDAMKEYNETHQDTPTAIKPLGFLMESANRVPLAQRIKVSVGNYLDNPAMNFDGSTMAAKSTGNKILDKTADFAGGLAGQALVGNGQVNMLNATDDIAQYAGNKIGGKLLPSLVRGATDAAAGTVLEDIGKGKGLKETAKDTLTNAAFGAGLFGLGKIGSEVLQDRGVDLITTSKKAYGSGINKIDNAQTRTFKQGDSLVKKEGLPQLPSPRDYTQKVNELPSNNDVIPMGGYMQDKTPVQLPNKPQESVKTNLDINTQAVQNNVPMTAKQASIPKIVHTEESISKIEDLGELDNVIKQLEDEVATTKDVKQKGLMMNLQLFAQKQKAEVQKKFKTTSNNPITVDNNGVPRAEQKIVSSTKDKSNWKDTLKKFYTRVVDTNSPLKPAGDKTYRLATNSKSVGGTVDYILQDGLVDRNGKKMGESLKTLVEDIPKKDYNDFWEYALQRHNIGRADQGKNVFPQFDSTASTNAVAQWEKVHPEWKGKADNFVKWIDNFMNEWGVNSGITDKSVYFSLREMYPNYLPTNRAFDDLEEFVPPGVSSKGFVNQKTPLKKATGSERDIIDPVENIMNLVNRTVRTARYNEVGQSLLKEIRKNPDKLVDIAEIVKGEVNPNLKNIVTVMQDGEPVNLQINDKSVLEALESVYKNTGDDVDNTVKKATNLFKTLITQKNPVFAIRNIARDIPTAYINGSEGNPLKFGFDLLSAGKDLVKNAPTAQQYRALGGGGANFFNSDNVAKSAKELTSKNPLKKIGGAIETFNNLTESAPRLAEFKRTVKKTGDLQQGLFAANDVTTNFSRGGDITKKIDAYVPYLNAGVQGMDKLARQFVNKPIATALKGATAITAPTLILDHFNNNNKNYQELDQRTKDNYFLIPNGETFIKIPKSRELGVVFSTLTERVLNAARGQEDAFKGFKTTFATNFSPANPIENNIFSPLAYNIPKNQDFAGRSIVPASMQDRSPQYQYDEATTEISKKLGELTGKSPKQIDYLIKAYTGVIGQLLQPATTKINYASGNALEKTLKPITTQFVADPLYSNKTLNEFYENYDKLKTSAADKNFAENVPSKKVTDEEALRNKYAKASKDISAISKQIKELEKSNDKEKIRELRRKMISIAESTNKLNK